MSKASNSAAKNVPEQSGEQMVRSSDWFENYYHHNNHNQDQLHYHHHNRLTT